MRLPEKYNYIPVLGAVLFGITTPLGIAVGLGVRETYNPESTTASIVSGILDAFSSGILLYTGLVEVRVSLHSVFPINNKPLIRSAHGTRVPLQLGHAPRVELEARVRDRMHDPWCRAHGGAWTLGMITILVVRS